MICDRHDLQTDFFLLRDGPVLVTSDRELWQAGIRWLRDVRGYRCHAWRLQSQTAFREEVSETLRWDEQFGYAPWNGNLDALNDGAVGWPLKPGRVIVAISNAERLKGWFGRDAEHLWEIFRDAARVQLLFGTGVLVMVHTSSEGEAVRWAKMRGVSLLTRKTFPGGQLAKDAVAL